MFNDFAYICQSDAPLGALTWYRLGGPARWLLSPRDADELTAVLRYCAKQGVPWRVLGRGANVLIRDEGFDGAVIRLTGPAFEAVQYDGARVTAGAGVDFMKLVRATVDRGLEGLERLAGVPGALGGIIRMNAGGKYGEVCEFVESVDVVDATGRRRTLTRDEVGFTYRHTALDGHVVLGATLKLAAGQREPLRQRHDEIWKEKAASQPGVGQRSAGCIFKNPPGERAGRLLDQCGLKGTRVGGAEISQRHANFIVADPSATASDIVRLITLAQARVHEMTGITLELEIDLW